ncbi:response regulator transcription factor [Thiolapillus brandeum]|uniref:Two-component system OmpR family response regulator PhoP n=1 Tax=Thiolapillus brandeum TaxID=1076588 RepID=A0A7U6GIA2_9GAMM|nr:response regulator transcription factor [Thiolapillus brandeum]BAO44156.1 two-component system OmpR family response regulator PhoP [Thiolapillus brandeum]
MHLLLIEDDAPLRGQLARQLETSGYAVAKADNGAEGLYLGRELPLDIAIVDLGLPDISGMEIIRTLREEGRDFPILILTARGRWEEKVEGLEAGADDYLVKPFQIEELLARLNALLRRSGGWASPVLSFAPLELDTMAQQVQVDGKPVALTAYEYRVLEYLAVHAGKVISKSELTEHIYDQDYDRDSNVLEVLLSRLRRKLDPDGDIQPIETLRGRGYRFSLKKTRNS